MTDEAIKSKFGDILPFSAARKRYNRGELSTGSVAFDFLINGGFHLGQCSCLWGPTGCGKTTSLMIAIGQALAKNPTRTALFIDLDLGLNPDYGARTAQASASIVKPLIDKAMFDKKKGLWVVKDDNGIELKFSQESYEQTANYAKNLAKAIEDKLYWIGRKPGEVLQDIILEQIAINKHQIIVIDPQDEIYPSSRFNVSDKEDQGKRAKYLGDFSAIIKHAVADYDTAIVYTSQMRTGRGQNYSYPDMTGGNRFRHNMDLIVRYGNPKVESFDVSGKQMLGQTVALSVEPGSRSCPSTFKTDKPKIGTGSYINARLIYGYGWDNDFALMELGEYLQTIEANGSYYSWIDKGGEVWRGHGRSAFLEAVRAADRYEELWDNILKKPEVLD